MVFKLWINQYSWSQWTSFKRYIPIFIFYKPPHPSLYPMYLSSDRSSITVLCHHSLLSIIHHCNWSTGSVNHHHPRQRLSNFLSMFLFCLEATNFFQYALNWEATSSPKTFIFIFPLSFISDHFSWSINVWLLSGKIS